MERPLVGITVSVNLSSVLELVIPINLKHFDKWFIITDPADRKTAALCKEYGKENIELILFDFSKNSIFNKGGGIKVGQELAYLKFSQGWYLVLDSDIILPDNFPKHLLTLTHQADTLYGVRARFDFLSLSAVHHNIYEEYKYGDCFTGFFQLYADKKKYYQNSNSIDMCDNAFRDQFSLKRHIENLHVHHLGKSGIGTRYLINSAEEHWEGNPPDQFLIDREPATTDMNYIVPM